MVPPWLENDGWRNHFLYVEKIAAAYFNYNFTVKKWSVQLGLRAENTCPAGKLTTVLNKDIKAVDTSYVNIFPNIVLEYKAGENNTIGLAYWLGKNIGWIRTVLILLIAYPLIKSLRNSKWWQRFVLALVVVLFGVIFYYFNFRFEADKMFYQPKIKTFAAINKTGADTVLVIGVAINGEAKAFQIIYWIR